MQERGQTAERLEQIRGTLAALGEKAGLAQAHVTGELPPPSPKSGPKKKRGNV